MQIMFTMQDKNYSLIKNAIWAAVVISCVTVGSISYYLSKKSGYETKPQRIQSVRELIDSKGFQDYTQKRKELADKMIKDPTIRRTGHITSVLESALGEFEPKEFIK